MSFGKEQNFMPDKILIVDDETEIADLIEVYLKNEEYTVFKFYTAEEALKCIQTTPLDLAILDVMLPDINGFTLCQKIREQYTYPVIMLTAKDAETDKITGLTLGADDYLEKPIDIDILSAKISALFKRLYDIKENTSIIKSGQIEINQDTMEVSFKGKKLNLTIKEYDLLLLL